MILVRVIDGKINKRKKLLSNNQEYIIEKVGVFTPKPVDVNELNSGENRFYNHWYKIFIRNKSR